MVPSKSKVAMLCAVLLCIAPQCQFDDDPTAIAGSAAGGASGSGGTSPGTGGNAVGGGFVIGTGGESLWRDAGPKCVENLPSTATVVVRTHSAADVSNCALVLEESPEGTGLVVDVYLDCTHVDAVSEDGGANWSFSAREKKLTFSAAVCDALEANPAQRIDVGFHVIFL